MTLLSAVSNQHSAEEIRGAILRDGFSIVTGALPPETISRLSVLFESVGYGERNLLDLPEIRNLAMSSNVKSLVRPVLGTECFAVRAILFDKTPEANWNVVWHQDRVIAVSERKDVVGFTAWTVKDTVQHVQPPSHIVAGMLAVRLHLDDCGEHNGPLQVIPGSHESGFIGNADLQEWKKRQPFICSVTKGAAILMRPLLLHSSLKSTSPHRRRVIHIEFASSDLPSGLEWHTRVA